LSWIFPQIQFSKESISKHSLGTLDIKSSLKDCFDIIINTGFTELPVNKEHLLTLSDLPSHHRDPFDRLLIAQAITEQLKIITKDDLMSKYDVETFW
jgi:PIN domain nuclease of toxin-antitoxin system